MTDEKREILTKETVGVRTSTQYAENPFMQTVLTEVHGKKKHYSVLGRQVEAINTDTGESLGEVQHSIVRFVDDTQFVKVFADGIAGIYDLKSPGTKVFRYLFDTVQKYPNVDRFYLYFMDAAEEPWSIPKTTFFRGLGELLDKNFIARSTNPHMFYLNPKMIWNGDRFKFITEYRRESTLQQQQITSQESE